MKSKNIGRYIILALFGVIILATGIIIGKFSTEDQGIMQALPYIFIGIGAGVFGQNVGVIIEIWLKKKYPHTTKQKKIQEKDERNMLLRNMAKAKAFDLMVIVFGTMLLALAVMESDLIVTIALVISYLFVLLSSIYFMIKLNNEL